jgi:hypothetical protein
MRRPSAMILGGLFVVFLLLAGVCSMDSDDDSKKTVASKRKSYIGRNGLSPAVPPKAVESPGGTVSTPLGSELEMKEGGRAQGGNTLANQVGTPLIYTFFHRVHSLNISTTLLPTR